MATLPLQDYTPGYTLVLLIRELGKTICDQYLFHAAEGSTPRVYPWVSILQR